jgi:excisionase family DNA binding protein
MSATTERPVALAVSRDEAAQQFGVSLDTFERHVQPHLRTVKVGRRVLVPCAELQNFLRGCDGS